MQSPSNACPLAPTPVVTDVRRTFVVFAVCLVLMLWLLARPYVGLRHDGELYLAQVLLHWRPEVMSHDLFFQFGSQDRYTIVARLLARLYEHVDMAAAQIVLIALGQLAMLVVLLAWLRRMGLDPVECTLGLAAICVMSHNYGGYNIFSFSERFVTGRIFAEPLAMAGLLLVERRRIGAGLLALLGALLFHPLVTVPVLVIAWGVLVVRDRRWAWALLGVPVFVALAAAGIAPFSALLQQFDTAWWDVVKRSNGQVFVLGWRRDDWALFVFDCGVVWVAGRLFPAAGNLLRVLVVAAIGLTAVSAICADLLHNVLITQLQLWRVQWVTHLLSLALLPVLLLRTWRRDDLRSHIVVLAAMAAAVSTNVRYANATIFTAWAGAALCLHVVRRPVEERVLKLARAVTAAGLVGTCVLVLVETGRQLAEARGHELDTAYLLLLAVTMPAISLPVTLGLLRVQLRGGTPALGALVGVLAAIVFGVAHWDQRPAWTRFLEASLTREHPFERLIGPQQQVLWWEQAGAVWAVLHRPSYYSSLQGAGLLFNRATAMEHQRRGRVVGYIQLQADACEVMGALGIPSRSDEPCWPTVAAIEYACGADGGPDFMILDRKLDRGFVADWSFEPSPGSRTTYYLHDCKQIR